MAAPHEFSSRPYPDAGDIRRRRGPRQWRILSSKGLEIAGGGLDGTVIAMRHAGPHDAIPSRYDRLYVGQSPID